MQLILFGTAAVLVVLAVVSGWAEHRRRRRIDLDKVGVMPWPLIQFLSLLAAFIAASMALRMR